MKYISLFSTLLTLASYNYTTPSLITEQPVVKETFMTLGALHCLDAITDTSQKYCPPTTRTFYNCCKASLCIGTAYSFSGEVMDVCGIDKDKEPLIRSCLTIGADFALLQLAREAQVRFTIKTK